MTLPKHAGWTTAEWLDYIVNRVGPDLRDATSETDQRAAEVLHELHEQAQEGRLGWCVAHHRPLPGCPGCRE